MINRQLLLTTDKMEIKDSPKLPSVTSFIRTTLAEIFIQEEHRCLELISKML